LKQQDDAKKYSNDRRPDGGECAKDEYEGDPCYHVLPELAFECDHGVLLRLRSFDTIRWCRVCHADAWQKPATGDWVFRELTILFMLVTPILT
jgi:hypothetical protein